MPPVKIDDVNKNKAGPQTCCDNTACTCESCGDNVACTCHNDAITSSAALFIDSFDDKRTTPSSSSSSSRKQVVKKSVIKKEKEEGSVTIGIFVGGMTCSNCSNSVSNAIKSSSQGIQDVKINLSTEYALVTFKPHFMNKRGMEEINSIVESIEDAGYEATLDMSTIPVYMRGPATIEEESVTIGISVGGMTCSTCSNSVSNAIKASSPNEGAIQDVKINLSTEYALVTFKPHLMNKQGGGMEAVNSIIESIEDAGYEATLDMSTVPPAILNPTSDGMDIEMNGGETVMSSAENRAKVLKERQERDTRKKLNAFLLSCIGSVPILIITMILGRIPGLSGHGGALQAQIVPGFTVEALVLWLLATPVQFGSGWTFYKNSYHNIKNKLLGMDVLVALGTSTAYFYSVGLISKGIHNKMPMHDAPHFFETSAVLISFVLLGRWLQARAVRRTSSALEKLMDLAAKTALVIIPENNSTNSFDPTVDKYEEKEVPAESVQKHDIVKIIRGSSIPADGKVLSGELTVNESMITGEPMPVYKHIGYDLIGGTIVAEGTAFMIVRNVGKDTALSKICRMVEEATAGRAPIQEYADKVSSIFVPFVVIIAVITFVIWMSLAEAGVVPEEWYVDNMAASSTTTFSLLFAISVLVISCPCALGLATPTAVMVGTGVGASHGILIKGGEQLQNASEIQAIIFDKTGTLTKGKPVISDFLHIALASELDNNVWLLASLERNSEHPLASAVVSYAEQNIPDYLKRKPLVDPSNFIAVTGKGVSGTVESVRVSIGNRTYTQEMVQGPFTEEIEQALIKIESAGKTGVLASVDGVVAAIIGISDAIREDSILSVQYLQEKKKVEVWMVTGDNNRTAHAVAKQIGLPIENVIAEAVPGDKLAKVKSFQQEGKVVGMVGDGINDSPALAQADVGIALGTGTDIASEAADIILVKGNVADVCTAIDLSRTIFRRIRFNYVWALLYNCLGIPIAAGVFYPLVQIRLPPTVAAAAMALSSISVVVSSLALKLYKPPKLSITNADNVA